LESWNRGPPQRVRLADMRRVVQNLRLGNILQSVPKTARFCPDGLIDNCESTSVLRGEKWNAVSTEVPSTASPPVKEARFSQVWRSLRHHNFRLYFGGQSIFLIGTLVARLATSCLVSRLTGSALLLGVVGFAGQIPTFLFAPFAGVWIDRLNLRDVLV